MKMLVTVKVVIMTVVFDRTGQNDCLLVFF
jgi:hypothetical protein